MAYKPSLSDIQELEEVQPTDAAYKPTMEDIPQLAAPTQQISPQVGQLEKLAAAVPFGPSVLAATRAAPPSVQQFAKGVPVGVEEFGRGALNIPRQAWPQYQQALQHLRGAKQRAPQDIQPITRQQLGIPEPTTGAERAGEFVGSLIPTAALPESRLLEAPKFIESALSQSGKAVKAIGNTLGIAGKNALVGAGLSPFYSPDQPLSQSTLTGGALGALGGPVLRGATQLPALAGKGLTRLMRMGGTATPEEIEQRAATFPSDVGLPLGEAIDSPALKQIQASLLSKIPGSGMAKKYHQIGEGIVKPVQDMFGDLESNVKTNGYDDVVNYLKDETKLRQKQSNKLYQDVDKDAENLNQKVNLSEFVNTADEKVKNAEKKQKGPLKNKRFALDPEFGEWLKDVADQKRDPGKYSWTTGGYIKPHENTKFTEATGYNVNINDKLSEAWKDGDKYKIGVLNSLKKALNKDIDRSVNQSGNEGLISKWRAANENYSKNLAPIEDKDILKFTRGKTNPSQLGKTFIKSGKEEEPEKLQKLLNLVPDNFRQSLAHHFLTKGDKIDNLDTIKGAVSNYNRLGPRTQQALLNPSEKKTLDNSLYASKLMGAQKNQMFIPKTGEQGASAKILMGIITALGGLGGAHVGGMPAALKTMAFIGGAPRAATAAVMSPKVRQMAIKAARKDIAKGTKSKADKGTKVVPALYGAILGK
jgi:hypothetical protein